ncbi:MAG: HisA/HisF-related TIM barrel protein [Planctomycetes bacterium]|nr:HisA/HisF-related TIM barrel protein [Planctomycetota bacterium]
MNPVRIMPCLDIKNGRVVKGVKFADLRDAADPVAAAVAYERDGADCLAFLDITATVEMRTTVFEMLAQVTAAVKLPVTLGGGIKAMADIEEAFRAGASAVSIASAAFRQPGFVKEAAEAFGRERIVAAIDTDASPELPSGREVIIDGGRTHTGRDAVDFAVAMRDAGAGAILATSKTADGSLSGYDVHGLRRLVDATGLPVIASGGAGQLKHFLVAAREGGASTLLAASVFHFGVFTIRQVKEYLRDNGVEV